MKTTVLGLIFLFMSETYSQTAEYSYLALGDSYTIGEQVELEKSWPYQLKNYLNKRGFHIENPKIIAVTGWRTDELLETLDSEEIKENSYDMVSLLIGVNNQYQDKPISQYEAEFETLLQKAIQSSKNDEKSVFVVGIPDYSESAYAKEKNLTGITEKLTEYNAIAKRICQKYDVPFYGIQEMSKPLHQSEKMLAPDALHPSALQYEKWLETFQEGVKSQLEKAL
ncbi:MAG: SGNH/GDSL hydrolase family protein [Psychroflexus sp.]